MVQGSYLGVQEFMASLVHVRFVHCYWMAASGVNHLVGLVRSLVVTGSWPGLMTSGLGRLVESVHCHQVWCCWLAKA